MRPRINGHLGVPGVDWLDPAAAKEEVKKHDDEDDVDDAATIVAVAGAHVVAAAAEEENEDDEQNDHLGEDAGGVEWGCPGGVVLGQAEILLADYEPNTAHESENGRL
jgi:hypothetical protein